ncbi:MAG: glycosyltransferase [Nitrospirae bacterium]|nr:glycosyltransferase [Nitrospirota bacterium]
MPHRKLSVAVITDPSSWYAEAGIIGGLARALGVGGHRVHLFDRSKLLSLLAAHRESLLGALRRYLERAEVDFVLGCNLNACLVAENRGRLCSLFDAWGFRSVTYVDDLVSGYLRGDGSIRSRIFQVLVGSERNCFAMHREQDATRVRALAGRAFYLPNAFDSLISVPPGEGRVRKVAFVGNVREEGGWRQRALLNLQSLGLDLFGSAGQPAIDRSGLRQSYRGRLEDTRAVYGMYGETRICVDANDEDGVISDRVFQAMGNGCMVVTPHKEELARFFDAGRDVVTYRDPAEIPSLVRHYLERDSEREKIARSGCRRVRADHTYLERARDLVARWREVKSVGARRRVAHSAQVETAGGKVPFAGAVPLEPFAEGVNDA